MLTVNTLSAQIIQFSQYYAAPLFLAPSYAGVCNGSRISANYRNQWPEVGAFNTYAVAYDQILAQIRDVNERIPNAAMTEKINEIESITREIFRAVEQEPEKRGKIDKFMSYFLPTTLKLLESYAKLEKTKVGGKNISQSMHSIEVAMDTIVDGFRHQLDELYRTDAVSIETEIDGLTKMINRETTTPRQEFGLGGQAVQTMPEEHK